MNSAIRNAEMPMTGGINCPPSEEAVSMAAAVTRGMPAPIIAGIVAEPTVMAFAAPLPLTVPTAMEPSTADCGSACGDRAAMRVEALSMDSTQPKARSALKTRMNEPISVSASCGRLEKTPVAISTLMAVPTRSHERPGWKNMPGTIEPYTA
jgi:hypothetical protein